MPSASFFPNIEPSLSAQPKPSPPEVLRKRKSTTASAPHEKASRRSLSSHCRPVTESMQVGGQIIPPPGRNNSSTPLGQANVQSINELVTGRWPTGH